MPTVLACLRRTVERMWPPRVPTRFGPGTCLRRPKNQWNQGPLATPQAEMCPRTANSGLCTRSKHQTRHLKLQPRAEHEALKAARGRIATKEGRRAYARRAGIEGTISQGVLAQRAVAHVMVAVLNTPMAAAQAWASSGIWQA